VTRPFDVPSFIAPSGIDALAFGGFRVGQDSSLVQLQFPYALNTQLTTATVANNGTVTQANSQALCTTGTTSNGSAILSGVVGPRYTPGQGLIARFTGRFTLGVASSTQIIGLGNGTDGFFFGFNGATFGILHRNNTIDTWIPQTTWNGDTFDAHGLSGAQLFYENLNVFAIRMQYLGAGSIDFFIEDPTTNRLVRVHTIRYANSVLVPSVTDPALGFYMQALNSGNTSSLVCATASVSIATEGPPNKTGVRGSLVFRKTAVGATTTNILTLKNATTFASKTNRIRTRILRVMWSAGGNQDTQFHGVKGATLGGTPAYTDFDATTSVVSYDVAGTTVSGGREILSAVVDSNNSAWEEPENLYLEPGEIITFGAQNIGAGGNIAPQVAVTFLEEW